MTVKKRDIFYRFIDKINIVHILLLFIVVIIISSILYYALSYYDHGLAKTFSEENPKQISYLDSLYFSIVVISSLGFGDLRPIGYGRLVATIEVLLGLILIGLAIAKISSERQGYYLKRLYASDHQKRILHYRNAINENTIVLKKMISHAIEVETIKETLDKVRILLISLNSYFRFELQYGDLLETVGNNNFRSLIRSVIQLEALIITQTTLQNFSNQEKKIVRKILKTSNQLAKMMEKNTTNEKLKMLCKVLRQNNITCNYLFNSDCLCPKCKSIVQHDCKASENSSKKIKCLSCGSDLSVRYDILTGFILTELQILNESFCCPLCNNNCEAELDTFPSSEIIINCDSCNVAIRVVRRKNGIGVSDVKESSKYNIIDEALLQRIKEILPEPPWQRHIHKTIALDLNISKRMAKSGINKLIRRGTYKN